MAREGATRTSTSEGPEPVPPRPAYQRRQVPDVCTGYRILILQNFWKFFSHRLNLDEKTRLFYFLAFSLEAYGSTVLKKLMRQVI